MSSHITVLKSDRSKREPLPTSDEENDSNQVSLQTDIGLLFKIKPQDDARPFKLIDDRDWNIVPTEPVSETSYFTEGHSAMSIVSVIGTKGVGKSSLLNKLARKDIFSTYNSVPNRFQSNSVKFNHITRGVDVYSNHHRMFLDCQPLLASSILEDFLVGRSNSQFSKTTQISDPLISCQMISLQLATFLIATSDYVVIMVSWLIDVHLLRLIASAVMMIGEDNVRTKFIMFSHDSRVHQEDFKKMIENFLGKDRVHRFVSDEEELHRLIAPYSSEKCAIHQKDPTTFTGKNWLSSCQRLWNITIKNSSMFLDYANQLYSSNYP